MKSSTSTFAYYNVMIRLQKSEKKIKEKGEKP
jgi:hypothetical protein